MEAVILIAVVLVVFLLGQMVDRRPMDDDEEP
jgi:hypothetical protein